MKKALITLLILAILAGGLFALYYFLWTPENLDALGDRSMESGHYDRAIWFYSKAADMDPENPEYVLDLADACIMGGSYTKAERSLVTYIRKAPSTELYAKLSSLYVAQDKLLDAQNLLDNITDPTFRSELDAMRPQAPVFSPESGEYSEYINLELTGEGSIYYSMDEQYPSREDAPYAEAIALPAGATHVKAIIVGDNGLVSPIVEADYLIVGVVEEVNFVSSELETYIRESLYIPRTSPVYTSDLWTVTELSVPYDVSDYSDLNYFTNLTSLRIEDSTVSDYSFLLNTPDLEKLYLPGCMISEETMEYIGGLLKLKELDLSNCSLSTITPIGNLTKLELLDLSGNSISDISAFASVSELRTLDLGSNAVTTLDSLAEATKLEVLDISENSVTTLTPLMNCASLININACGNQLTEIYVAYNLISLQHILIARNSVADLSPLASCPNLTYVDASQNAVTDISFMGALANLTYVDVSHNAITAIPALPEGARLQQFYASYNQLSDISPLVGLQELTYVDIDYNTEVEEIESLAACPLIVQVDAFGTKVSSVTALTNMGAIVNFDPTALSAETA